MKYYDLLYLAGSLSTSPEWREVGYGPTAAHTRKAAIKYLREKYPWFPWNNSGGWKVAVATPERIAYHCGTRV